MLLKHFRPSPVFLAIFQIQAHNLALDNNTKGVGICFVDYCVSFSCINKRKCFYSSPSYVQNLHLLPT